MFNKDNQMKDIGMKVIDSTMKEFLIEEGIYSLPQTIIKYETGKRPANCYINFLNHLKRSLFYREHILSVRYIYELEKNIFSFYHNFKAVET